MSSLVYRPGEAWRGSGIGGKARSLAVLSDMGQPVPPWYAVTAEAFRRTLAAGGLGERIERRLADAASGRESLRTAAAEVQVWLRTAPLPPGLEEELALAHADCVPDDDPVAVRSSALDEDGATASFAGLHDTVLGTRGVPSVLEALRRVWASLYSEAALAYRLARGLPLAGTAMAAVVQRLVPARVSGVLFTAHPVTGSPHEIVISALHGLGEGLVGEGLPADRYTLDKTTLDVRTELAEKREALVPGESGTLRRVEVPPELRNVGSLSPEQVLALARAGLEVERRFGRPQDVEFAVDADGRLFLLQARAVTTAEESGPAAGNRIVWSHDNWAENYPGVTLPMTYSVTRRLDRAGYRCFAEMMRIPRDRVLAHEPVLDTFLGYIRGRLYTNRINRHRLFSLLPGFGFHPKGLLALLNVRPDERDPALPLPSPGPLRRWLVELPALLRLFGGLAADFFRVRRDVDRLLSEAEEVYQRCAAAGFDTLRPHELIAIYDEVEARLVRKWKVPLLNALFLRLSYVFLKRLCRAWCKDETGSLQNELLRGEEGSQSGRPVRDLLALASTARRDPALRELFASRSPEDLARIVPDEPGLQEFAAEVERYLDRYSFKGVHEMKLETTTLRDRPELLYGMIRSCLDREDGGDLEPEARSERERRARHAAEARAFAALSLPRRLVFRRLLRTVRDLDRHREEVKLMRLRLIGLFRDLLRALGGQLAAEGILDAPGDVFYLGLEEVSDYVRGQALTADLRALVALRRRELEGWEAAGADDRFETWGPVYHRNRFRERQQAAPAATGELLRGTGCCQGQVTGEVCLAWAPEEADGIAGRILAVERVHTGWIPLFPAISGLLVERGEILSHCATVAREMGIPTIIGIPGLTTTLRNGQRVTLDGAEGTVRPLP